MAVPDTIQPLVDKRLQDATPDHEKALQSRQVEAADGAIDKMVYELYGLTGGRLRLLKESFRFIGGQF
ncbi:MAG: hypothetical protein Q7T80_16500 [Methanoregula sp.]|nr:hypothetical protein [Methanoregula sp.]